MMYWITRIIGFTVVPLQNLIYWIARLIPGLRKLPRISVPLRYAILSFVSLLIIAFALYLRYRSQDYTATRDQWLNQKTLLMVGGLLIVIPICVYFAVKMLMQGAISQFPDIDFAWSAGMESLKQNGVDVAQTPIFLVFGNADHATALNIHRASRISMNVKQIPEGPGALHWYANQEGVFLFLTNASSLSRLAATARASNEMARQAPGPAAARPSAGYTGTIQAGGGGGGASGGSPMQTIAPGASPVGEHTVRVDGGSPGPQSGLPPASSAAMQTMQASPMRSMGGPIPSTAQMMEPVIKPQLGPADINLQTARLEYVCSLIQRLRNPVCPINGALVLLPFQLVEQAPEQFQALVQRDLAVVRDHLKLRFPVTVMVHEMEREPGFRELVRRVGVERAKIQRFGKGNDVWTPPTVNRLEAVAKHACGAFEDWSYMLFREHDGLRKPGNSKLFSLLCRVRGDFVQNLERILAYGFGHNPNSSKNESDVDGLMFSGCYFSATGETEDRQAFVHSVLKKLAEQEAELSWTAAAVAEDEKYQLAANLFALAGFASFVWLMVMIAIDYKWYEVFLRK